MSSPFELQRILLVRLSAIGDAIATLPMLCALRREYPQSHITWVAEPGPAKVLRGHPALSELIVVPKGWLKSPLNAWKLRHRLRAASFDVSLDPQSLTKSAAVAWLSGTRRRIGFASPVGRELSLYLNNELLLPSPSHIIDRQLGLLEPLGITQPRVEFNLPPDEAAARSVAELLQSLDVTSPFVVINAGAGWYSRVWPAVRYGLVARQLGLQHGIRSVVVWAGERERNWAQEISQFSDGHAVVAPATDLMELRELLRKADLYLGSDTGPMHMAVAVGTRCVALFGTTQPQASGPYGDQHVTIQAYFQGGTSRERRRASNDAMRAIQVDEVIAGCEQALFERASKAA